MLSIVWLIGSLVFAAAEDEQSLLQVNAGAHTMDVGYPGGGDQCKEKRYWKDGPKITTEKDEGNWEDGRPGVPAESTERCNDLCNAFPGCDCFIHDPPRNRCNLKANCSGKSGKDRSPECKEDAGGCLSSCWKEQPPKTPCSGKSAGAACQGFRFKGKCKNVGGELTCSAPCGGKDEGDACMTEGGQAGQCMLNDQQERYCKPHVVTKESISLWQTSRECVNDGLIQREDYLGHFGTVEDCFSACKKKAAALHGKDMCNFLLFGKHWKHGHCYWEATDNCVHREFAVKMYDIYKRDSFVVREFELWKPQSKCMNGLFDDEPLGIHLSAKDCQQACIAKAGDACNFFIYRSLPVLHYAAKILSLGLSGDNCYWQHTDGCLIGPHRPALYDTYKSTTIGIASSSSFKRWQADRECTPYKSLLGILKNSDTDLGDAKSPEECGRKCIEKGGAACNFFKYNADGNWVTGGHGCQWQSTDSCSTEKFKERGLVGPKWSVYKRDDFAVPAFKVKARGKFCKHFKNEDQQLAGGGLGILNPPSASPEDCRQHCLSFGGSACNYFTFGKSGWAEKGDCHWEHTDSCLYGELQSNSHYDLYERVSEVSCGQHKASQCSGCPQGNGKSSCNGDCTWLGGQCVLASLTVSCGSHRAGQCGGCPQGNGAAWCNGDCGWWFGSCVRK